MNIVLTGGTSGLGYRTAQVLGKEIKNKIILIGSNKQKGETSVENLIKETSNNDISFIQCDLSSISETKSLADKLLPEKCRNEGDMNSYCRLDRRLYSEYFHKFVKYFSFLSVDFFFLKPLCIGSPLNL